MKRILVLGSIVIAFTFASCRDKQKEICDCYQENFDYENSYGGNTDSEEYIKMSNKCRSLLEDCSDCNFDSDACPFLKEDRYR